MRDPGSIPRGYLCETGILLLALSRYIGDPNVIDNCGLVWGGLCPKPSLGRCANNVIISLGLTQLFCPSFMLAAGPPSGFRTDIVGCWGGALWRACNLNAFIPCLTGPVTTCLLPVMWDLGSIPREVLMWNRDSPVSLSRYSAYIFKNYIYFAIGHWKWRIGSWVRRMIRCRLSPCKLPAAEIPALIEDRREDGTTLPPPND